MNASGHHLAGVLPQVSSCPPPLPLAPPGENASSRYLSGHVPSSDQPLPPQTRIVLGGRGRHSQQSGSHSLRKTLSIILTDQEEPSSRFSCPTPHLPQERPPSLGPPISISPHRAMTVRAWNLPHHYPYLHPSWPTSQTASRLCRRERCWSKEDSFPSLTFEISAHLSILL